MVKYFVLIYNGKIFCSDSTQGAAYLEKFTGALPKLVIMASTCCFAMTEVMMLLAE